MGHPLSVQNASPAMPEPEMPGPRAADPGSTLLKRTRTLCPTCLEPLIGLTFESGGRVYLERTCPVHGAAVALVSSERRHYYLRGEVPHPPPGPGTCCGAGPSHRTCIALLEITDACNLHCAACYAQSPNGKHRPFEELVATLDAYLSRGPLDVLQISGGEPTIHPRFLDIVAHAARRPDIRYVMINTNGLLLAQDPDLAPALARLSPGIEIYLQMDGLDPGAHAALRGERLLEDKRAAIARLVEHNLPTTLVCTVVEGVNDREIGDLLRLGLDAPQIRGVTFQPATYAGRFALGASPVRRSTLASVLAQIEAQTGGQLRTDDFRPLPCSDPNCCTFTFLARPEGAAPIPLTRLFRYEDHWQKLEDRMFFVPEDAGGSLTADMPPKQLFRVVVKPFMDAWTYDQDRIDECCLHILKPGGEPVSFCEYNVRQRGRAGVDELVSVGRRRPALTAPADSGVPDVIPPDFDPD